MYDVPVKYSLTVFAAAASGAASIVSEHTLIPLGIMVTCTGALVMAAWKVSGAVTRAADRLRSVENRISAVEADIKIIKGEVQ